MGVLPGWVKLRTAVMSERMPGSKDWQYQSPLDGTRQRSPTAPLTFWTGTSSGWLLASALIQSLRVGGTVSAKTALRVQMSSRREDTDTFKFTSSRSARMFPEDVGRVKPSPPKHSGFSVTLRIESLNLSATLPDGPPAMSPAETFRPRAYQIRLA